MSNETKRQKHGRTEVSLSYSGNARIVPHCSLPRLSLQAGVRFAACEFIPSLHETLPIFTSAS
jgi:hypothetical protein